MAQASPTLALALWAGCQAQNLAPASDLHPRGGSGDAGTLSSGGCPADAACCYITSGCPLTVPVQGLPCGLTASPCEYGDDPRQGCNMLATCTSTGWSVQQPATDPASGCPTPQPACPPTFPDSPDAIVSCPSGPSYECVYPEGNCLCFGGAIDCVARPNDCPTTRPRAGTPCAMDSGCQQWGESCSWGAMLCECGVWVPTFCSD